MTTDILAWAHAEAKSWMALWLVEALGGEGRFEAAVSDENGRWEPFQLDYLNMGTQTDRMAVAVSKTRQCGWSWILAAEALARGAVYPGSLTNIVSINRDEAEEKIRYVNAINEAADPVYRLKWYINNRGDLQATNGSRIRSQACTPPRGRPGAHHRLDECAHYQRPQIIYNAAFAGIGRKGSITCGSSPWTRGGFHYSLMEEPANYPDFVRMWVPWWAVYGLCTDPETANREAPAMDTVDRVERFGTDRLRFIYRNMPLDSFQVEFELSYADDNLAWITWQEIMSCTGDEAMVCVMADGIDEVRRALPGLLARPRMGDVFAGYDVGRQKDLSVLALMELVGGVLVCFAVLTLPNLAFADQKALLKDISPIVRSGCIDATGLGANLAEDMHRHSARWHGVVFTQPSKAQMASDLREQFQGRAILIPPDRDLQRDIHSVHRIVTAANNIVYDTDRDEGLGHADRFWALALGGNACLRQFHGAGEAVLNVDLRGPASEDRVLRVPEGFIATDEVGRPVDLKDIERKLRESEQRRGEPLR